ncbi:MAG: hypothetical protein ABFS10_00210 [Bacteroidota bacterium]
MSSKRFHIRDRGSIWLMAAVTAALVLITGNFTGCEPEDWIGNVNCNDCFGYKPDSADLIIHLTINAENDSVPLIIYEGDTGGDVDWRDTAVDETFYLKSRMHTTYTVRAQYRSGSKTIIAFDSDRMTLKDYSESCGSTCYIVKGGIFDLTLPE